MGKLDEVEEFAPPSGSFTHQEMKYLGREHVEKFPVWALVGLVVFFGVFVFALWADSQLLTCANYEMYCK